MLAVKESSSQVTPKLRSRSPQNPAEQAVYQQIRSYSQLWWPGRESRPDSDEHYKVVLRHNARSPQRLCFPMEQDRWLESFAEALRVHGSLPYSRVPIQHEKQVWYFFDRLEDARALLKAAGPSLPGAKSDQHWLQRIKLPFDREHYHTHLGSYLRDRSVVPVRMVAESDGEVWYFLHSLNDVGVLLAGLDSCRITPRPDGGEMLDRVKPPLL